MGSFGEVMQEYKKQLEKGTIQQAYKGLVEYIAGLRAHFSNSHPEYNVSGSIYYGFMDMTYFALFPESMKQRGLKIAVVFLHEAFRFEVWLAAVNKGFQAKYWLLIKQSGWDRYRLVPTIQGYDSILEHVLVVDPDFSDLEALTRQIESETLKFIEDIEGFLAAH